MGEKLTIGPVNKGLRTDREPFNIDNDNFPILKNAYQWRGRVKRKRGTSPIARLQREIGTTDIAGDLVVTINPSPIDSGIVSFKVGTDVFVDPGGASPIALLTNSSGTATLDRVTGVLTITGSQVSTAVIYFPTLPVMGLEEFLLPTNAYPGNISFDTRYAYSISTSTVGAPPYAVTDISFYKNPSSGDYTAYVAKGTQTPLWWNGASYQQFWTVNYQNAFWATNGVDVPFTGNTIGMQFADKTLITAVLWINATTVNFTITGNVLVIGDFVFVNEFTSATAGAADTLNFQTGYVTNVAATTITVKFQNANITNAVYAAGMIQYLTNSSDTTKDCIRWYDGTGWVNFMPPLSQSTYSIGGAAANQYYLVGAKLIYAFKDRLLFFGPVIQTSSAGAVPIYLEDTVVFSQNGTAYYTASFKGDIFLPTEIQAILTPVNEVADPKAFWEDQAGFGGFISAGVEQAITTVSPNEDALIVGFRDSLQTRFIYTGNDILPFNFFIINAELGSASTFSIINMDEGVLTKGPRGFIITSQTRCQRIDLEIIDLVFDIVNTNNGAERFTAQRDFINEWIYFTYLADTTDCIFPNQTLIYNYRDHSWGIFDECYTTYGQFRPVTGYTWGTIGSIYPTWGSWNTPWGSGSSEPLQPEVIAGNQQGYVVRRNSSTAEVPSLAIQDISGSTVTSPNHCLNTDDYVIISGALGTVGAEVNGKVFQIDTVTTNTFDLDPDISAGLTYLGGGEITRLYVPQIYSRQFPMAWGLGRKTRIGVQQYLFTATSQSQIQLKIYLSQNEFLASNDTQNDALVYSTTLYTCPESTNLGLTQANTNLLQFTNANTGTSISRQIWHRVNTSLIGDTVQIAFTMSDAQMRDVDDNNIPINAFSEIEFHGAILDVSPSSLLS